MKKYFKVIGLALLAAGMFSFTACSPDDEEVIASEDGVTVSFGDYTWKAQFIDGMTARTTSGLTSRRSFAFYATPQSTIGTIPITVNGEQVGSAYATYPMIYVFGNTKGTEENDEMIINYLEKEENTYAFADEDGEYDLYGWENGEDMTISVTNFDNSSFVISGTVNGTLYEISSDNTHTGNQKSLHVVFKNIAHEDMDAE